jgi:hypothetical protein
MSALGASITEGNIERSSQVPYYRSFPLLSLGRVVYALDTKSTVYWIWRAEQLRWFTRSEEGKLWIKGILRFASAASSGHDLWTSR